MKDNQNLKFVSDSEFRERAEKGEHEGLGVHKGFSSEVRNIDEKNRTIDFTISTETVDRMGDVIKVSGWQLDNYKNNPVVLFGHDHSSPPIGKAVEIRKRPKKRVLESTTEFLPKDLSPFADMIFQMYVKGFMKATSVGFVPLEFEFSQDESRQRGIDFMKQDLLEYSAVSVPANPEALIGARSKGIDTLPLKLYAEKTLDEYEEHEETGLIIPRKTLEQLRKLADPKNTKSIAMQDNIRKENLEKLAETKTAITYGRAHSGGTPKAPKDQAWDGGAAMKAASSKTYHIICAWYDPQGSDDDKDGWPDQRGNYKLPHHNGNGSHSVVWRGVANAAARLPNTNIPGGDVSGVQAHLGKHYSEFDETPPWKKDADGWNDYVDAMRGFRGDFECGLVESTDDMLELRNAGLKLFDREVIDDLIFELADDYGLEKTTLPDIEEEEIDETETEEKDLEEEDTVIEIETSEDKDLEETEEKDEDSEEEITKDESETEEIEQMSAPEPDAYEVAEALLEMMELAFEMIEDGDLEIDEFLDNRRGRRVLNNLIDLTKEFSDVLANGYHWKHTRKPEDESGTEDKDVDDEDTFDVIELSDSEDGSLDIDPETLKLISEEVKKAVSAESKSVQKRLYGIPDEEDEE